MPWLNAALARHPAFGHSVAILRECGVTVLLDEENLPGDDEQRWVSFPWEQLRAELARIRVTLASGGSSG